MPDKDPQPESPRLPEQLDLFLDGQLSDSEARDVESMIQRDRDAQHAVADQARIDESLKRQFQPPESDQSTWLALATRLSTEPAPPEPTPRRRAADRARPATSMARQRRTLALAIAASIACIAFWGSRWEQLSALWSPPEGGYGQMTVAQVYRAAVDDGFKPDWFCEDERLFAETFEQRQGQGLLLNPLPDGVRMAGLAYLKGFTPRATCMLAYVDEEPVLVLAARTERIDKRQLEAPPEVAVFQRELGDLTLVEVLPAKTPPGDSPRLLPYFYSAGVPEQPTGRVPGSR